MYKCEECGNLSKPNEKLNRVVVDRRPRVYRVPDSFEERSGWEIAREICCCARCAKEREL